MSGENNIQLGTEKSTEPKEICTCDNIQQMIYEYLDNELADNEKKAFENHISKCGVCKEVYENEQKFKSAVKMSAYTPTLSVADFVMEKIIGEKITINKPSRKRPIPFGLISAAVIILATLVFNRVPIGQLFINDEWSVNSKKDGTGADESDLMSHEISTASYNESISNYSHSGSADTNIMQYSSGEAEIKKYALDGNSAQDNDGIITIPEPTSPENAYFALEEDKGKEKETKSSAAEHADIQDDTDIKAQSRENITLPEPLISVFTLEEEPETSTARIPEIPELSEITTDAGTAYSDILPETSIIESESVVISNSLNDILATDAQSIKETEDAPDAAVSIVSIEAGGTDITNTAETINTENIPNENDAENTEGIESIETIDNAEIKDESLTETGNYSNVRIIVQVNFKFEAKIAADIIESSVLSHLNQEDGYVMPQITADKNTVLIECGDTKISPEKIIEILTANNISHSVEEINPGADDILLVFEP